MEIIAAIGLIGSLVNGVRNAIAAGKSTVSEADLDAAIAALEAGDKNLSDAIARAKARRAATPPGS